LLGWAVLQDVTTVALESILLAALGVGDRPLALALGGLIACRRATESVIGV
jgi:hypothetical protein